MHPGAGRPRRRGPVAITGRPSSFSARATLTPLPPATVRASTARWRCPSRKFGTATVRSIAALRVTVRITRLATKAKPSRRVHGETANGLVMTSVRWWPTSPSCVQAAPRSSARPPRTASGERDDQGDDGDPSATATRGCRGSRRRSAPEGRRVDRPGGDQRDAPARSPSTPHRRPCRARSPRSTGPSPRPARRPRWRHAGPCGR